MPDSGPLFTAGLIFSALAFAAAVGLVAAEKLRKWQPPGPAITASLVVYGSALLGTVLLGGQGWQLAVPLALGLATKVAAHRMLRDFTVAGRLLLTTNAQLMLFGLAWGAWFIATIPVSTLTRALLFAGYSLLFLTLPTSLVGSFEQWEMLCRRTWWRPRTPLPAGPRDRHPKVSLHVPAYAEPPEVVIATLDALARLRYPNFEVLVIDNNTRDPGLWRPVETYCRRLGERFRTCMGGGAFYGAFPAGSERHWREVERQRNFLDWIERVDWLLTNPPWLTEYYRRIFEHCFEVANNVVLLVRIDKALATYFRLNCPRRHGFGLKEIVIIPWRDAGFRNADGGLKTEGFVLGCFHWQRGHPDITKWTFWTDPKDDCDE